MDCSATRQFVMVAPIKWSWFLAALHLISRNTPSCVAHRNEGSSFVNPQLHQRPLTNRAKVKFTSLNKHSHWSVMLRNGNTALGIMQHLFSVKQWQTCSENYRNCQPQNRSFQHQALAYQLIHFGLAPLPMTLCNGPSQSPCSTRPKRERYLQSFG